MVLCGLIGATMGTWKETEKTDKQDFVLLCIFKSRPYSLDKEWNPRSLKSSETFLMIWSPVSFACVGSDWSALPSADRIYGVPAELAPAHGAKTHLASIPSKIYEVLWRGRWEAQMPKAVININNTPTVPQVLCHTAGINELCSDPWQFTFWRSMQNKT